MPLSGLVAGGVQGALDEVQERRLKELVRQLQEKQQADQLALQTRQVEGIEADRAANRDNQRRTIDLANLQRTDTLAKEATERNARSDMANVLNMPGMAPEAINREIAGSSMRTGVDVPRTVLDLIKVPDKERDPIADYEAKKKLDRKYDRPPAGPAAPRTPQWVRMADGSLKDLNNVAPPGSGPVDVVADRQKADKTAGNERAVAAMKAYGDDMLSVIDSLIDETGNLKPDVAGVIGGFEGARPEWAYATEGSQGALANIDRLQSMLNIDTLRDMKSQSRTGATGFGALSERELNVVESSASKLRRRRQGDAEYAAELKRIRDAIMAGRGAVPSNAPPSGSADLSGVSLRFNPATGKLEPVRQ